MSDSLLFHGQQRAGPPCPSPTPGVHSNSCPLSQWCHPTISSSAVPFSSAFSLSQHQGLFQSQFFTSGGQSIGVSASASVLPMNIQDWFPLEWAGWISRVSPTPQFKCTVLGHLSWFLLEWRFKNRLVMWYNSAEVFLPSFFNIRKFGLWYNSCMISSQPTQPLWASVSSYVE